MFYISVIIGILLRIIPFRFSKYHRHNKTWFYTHLNSVMINQIAAGLPIKKAYLIYNKDLKWS